MKSLILSSLLALVLSNTQAQSVQKEYVFVKEAALYFDTKFDSVAEYSVINASRIVVFNNTLPLSKNIGKEINFVLYNEKGEKKNVNSKVSGTAMYNGQEKYWIELNLNYDRVEKMDRVILDDLSSSEFKLIVGKSWNK